MKSFIQATLLTLSAALILCAQVHAEVNEDVKQLQQEWARIKYTLDKKQHENALEKLSLKAALLRESQSDNADAHLWEGIILSTYAGAIGTLRALSTVNRSRDALEKSLEIDLHASTGAANTYLGTLYLLVPEWPIAFGDLELAKEYLDKAIKLNPDDIDVNYYFGELFKKQRKYKHAEAAYKKAILAPARPGRDVADEGRRGEAKEHLEKMLAKIK
jgi:tetratricopeptide (TPR) repeat protein